MSILLGNMGALKEYHSKEGHLILEGGTAHTQRTLLATPLQCSMNNV